MKPGCDYLVPRIKAGKIARTLFALQPSAAHPEPGSASNSPRCAEESLAGMALACLKAKEKPASRFTA